MEEQRNFLIPKHRKLSKAEVQELLDKYQINSVHKLPRIKIKDPGLELIEEEINLADVIEITRNSFAGETKYYRVVIEWAKQIIEIY